MSRFYVIKFGGSVQKNCEDIEKNINYVMSKVRQRDIVIPVVSAPYGVTDSLKRIWELKNSEGLDFSYKSIENEFGLLLNKSQGYIQWRKETKESLQFNKKNEFITSGEDLGGILHQLEFRKRGIPAEYFDGSKAGIMGNQKVGIDLEGTILNAGKDTAKGLGLLFIFMGHVLSDEKRVAIIGGYRGRHKNGYAIQLPDNSTDGTAMAIAVAAKKKFGNAFDYIVEMIKDVDGIKEVNFPSVEGKIIKNLNYREAIEITSNGAEVVYPVAIDMARQNDIPIAVKSRDAQGTLISKESGTTVEKPVAAISIEKRYQINIIDPKMINPPQSIGYLEHVLSFFSSRGIDIKYTPDSAETITLTIDTKKAKINDVPIERELEDVLDYLSPEIEAKEIYLVSIIGEGMKRPGVFAKAASVLDKEGVSIKSASQPEEDVAVASITLGIDPRDIDKAAKSLYSAFF